ncbi:MAG: fibro-slime domain-containing protein [Clostridiales bacterium]|nr:fibro-slime domain-containing protein [Clostridiales bacterium]
MRNLIQRFEKAVLRKKVVRHRCATVLAASALAAAICAYGQMNPEAATTSMASSSDWEESDSSGDAVREVTYAIEDGRIIGYALVPDSEIYTLSYTGEDYAVIVSYGGDALVPEDAELVVTEYDSDSEVWQNRYEETAALYGWEDEETEEIASDANATTVKTLHHGFRLFDIDVYADGEEVELAAEATVYITFSAGNEPESCMVTSFSDGAADVGAVKGYESGNQIVSFGTEKLDSYGISLTTVKDSYTILNFEGDDYIITVTYDEEAGLPEGTELSVSEYGMDSETWHNRYNETALLYGWTEEEAYSFRLFDISLLADGEKIEPSADVNVVISLLEKSEMKDYTVTHYGEEKTETIEATSEFEEGMQSVSFDAAEFSDYSLATAANPTFTVQYYAYLDLVSKTGDNTLTVIDTSGGNLPKNGTDPSTTTMGLKKSGTNSLGTLYKVATESTLTQVYSDGSYTYSYAPKLEYVNKLAQNTGYTLKEIWVLKSGKDSSSITSTDWDSYTYSDSLTFTNTASAASGSCIYIDNSTVMRLVYDTNPATYTNKANLYDYDISDGKTYKSASTTGGTTTNNGTNTVYAYTYLSGINSNGNYSGSGTKLGFGNDNTGSGLGALLWSGNLLNKYNTNGYKGCTFGLVSSLDSGIIDYSSGVVAPNLFDDGSATGKTTYNNQNLIFDKDGDTYTLTKISGDANITDLDTFLTFSAHGTITTNNFWPMDTVASYGTSGHDLKFGDSDLHGLRKHFGNGSTGNFSDSDDGSDHNSYFGMQYAVDFTLTADYVGPLNYYFFGDDDMWVFLDGELVCDIGGVHSSVGEYVDLWDYIIKGSAGPHTLSFYYTERGASGSTCYMRFTLPSVSSNTPVQDTGNLRVEKEVSGTGADSQEEFKFTLGLKDSSGDELTDTYGYTIHNSDDTQVSTGTITSGGTFELSDGQYIIVSYLPDGTECTVTETSTNYVTTYKVDSGSYDSGLSASTSIVDDDTVVIHFLNTREYTLPESGGSGVWMFASIGVALCGAAGVVFYQRRRRI